MTTMTTRIHHSFPLRLVNASAVAVLAVLFVSCSSPHTPPKTLYSQANYPPTSTPVPATTTSQTVSCSAPSSYKVVVSGPKHMAPETYYMAKASQNIFEELSSYIDSAWPQGTVSPTAAEGWIDSVDPASPVLQDFKTGPQSVSTWPGGKPTPQAAAPYAYDAQFLMWQGNDGKPYVNPFHPITVANEHFDSALEAGNNVFAIKPDGHVAFMCVPWAVEFEITSGAHLMGRGSIPMG